MKRIVVAAAVSAALAACAPMMTSPGSSMMAPTYEDGELPLPANYTSWPKFLSAVQRPDAKQVREIYVNPTGTRTASGQPFPNGTVFVMENWTVKLAPDGRPEPGADGKLIKDKLARVLVMGKGAGYGAKVPAEIKNGDWVYASYDAAGAKTADNLTACRSCHLPMAKQDFVARYDEYFAKR